MLGHEGNTLDAIAGLSFFYVSFFFRCLFPVFHKEISRQDRLATTIANSVDPQHPRFCPSSSAFCFSKVDCFWQPIASKEILVMGQSPIIDYTGGGSAGGKIRLELGNLGCPT
jgi:hypothetical protein